MKISAHFAAVAFLTAAPRSVRSQESFTCARTVDGAILDAAIGYEWCLDHEPIPPAIFTPSFENVFLTSQQVGGGPVATYLGGGHYVIGDGSYMSSLYIYDDGEKQSKKKKKKKKKPYGALLMDAAPSFGPEFGMWLKDFLDGIEAELKMFLFSHEHYDHVGNFNSVMAANPTLDTFIASKVTTEVLERWGNPDFSHPRVQEIFSANPNFPDVEINKVIEESGCFNMGNQTLNLVVGPGHTEGGIMVWHEASKAITIVDSAVFPKWAVFFEFAVGNDVEALFRQFDMFREYDYDYFIGGHLTHIGTPEDVDDAEDFVVDILDAAWRSFTSPGESVDIGTAAGAVNPSEPPNAGNSWLIFQVYLNQIAVTCADIVMDASRNLSGKNWPEAIAAPRAVIFSHCRALADTLRVDSPGI